MAQQQSGYYGKRRKFWSWGYEEEGISDDEVKVMAKRVKERLGMDNIEVKKTPTLDDIELKPSRIKIPATLEHFCTSDKWDRVVHTYGKGFKDMMHIFRRDYDRAPDVIAYPTNEEQIAAVYDWCGENNYACIPFGGGSSVTGGFWTPEEDEYNGSVIIDLGNLNKVLEVDEASQCALIQGGTLGPSLENQLKPHGLTLRHIPQSWEFSSLGGWIATRGSGHYATHLTHIDDMVESLRMVTPAGVIENRRLPGSGAGPDPDRLLIGSEGTMGIITEAWMKLRGRVKFRANASITFPSFYQGAEAVRQITQAGLYPANARYLDEQDAKFYGAGDGTQSVLLLGFESADHSVDAWLEVGLEICRDHGGTVIDKADSTTNALENSRSGPQGNWRHQFRYLPRLMHTRAAMGIVSFTFETSYTWDKFEKADTEIMERVWAAIKESTGGGILCRRFSFLYPDGPAPYYSIMAKSNHDNALEAYQYISNAASDALMDVGATITHHHAVGKSFRPWYDKEVDPLYRKALAAVKGELDPNWIMNPGLLIDRPKPLKIVG